MIDAEPGVREQPAEAPAGAAESAPSARHWYTIGVLTILYMLAMLDRSILSLLVVPIKQDFGVSDVQMSLLLGLSFAVFYSLLTIPAGYVVDRFSRRLVIGVGVVLWSAMTMSAGAARSFTHLFFARMGVGIGEAGISPAAFSIIRNTLPARQHGRAFSIYALGPVLGNAGAFMIGGLLLSTAEHGAFAAIPVLGGLRPWQAVLFIVGFVGLPLSLLVLTLREPARPIAPAGGTGATFGDALRHVRANGRDYACILLFATSLNMVAAAYSAWTPTIFSRNFDLKPTEIAFRIGTIALVCSPLGLLIFGTLIDRLATRGIRHAPARIGVATSLAVGVLGTALPLAATPRGALILLAMLQLVIASFYTIAATLMASLTPVRLMGKLTALYLAFTGVVAQSLGPFIAAYVGQRFLAGPRALGAGVSVTALSFAAIGLTAIIVLLRSRRPCPPA